MVSIQPFLVIWGMTLGVYHIRFPKTISLPLQLIGRTSLCMHSKRRQRCATWINSDYPIASYPSKYPINDGWIFNGIRYFEDPFAPCVSLCEKGRIWRLSSTFTSMTFAAFSLAHIYLYIWRFPEIGAPANHPF